MTIAEMTARLTDLEKMLGKDCEVRFDNYEFGLTPIIAIGVEKYFDGKTYVVVKD